jgi:hypothetical protein
MSRVDPTWRSTDCRACCFRRGTVRHLLEWLARPTVLVQFPIRRETMATVSRRMTTAAAIVMFVGSLFCCYGVANSSPQPTPNGQGPQIVAAGTATWTRPRWQANNTNTRVKLAPEIAAQIGTNYIVLLTNRSPVGGYPWFSCYWSIANDGFDITLIDPSITGGANTASYDNNNTSYLVDWVVVKK